MWGIWRIRHGLEKLRKARLLRSAEKAVARFPQIAIKQTHGLPGELVVSLTSYPARYGTLCATVKSLLDQRIKADRTVLWLAQGDIAKLPREVTALQAHGLEIRSCSDLRSFKKIVPSLTAFPAAYIVTADDDLYYPPDWLERLVNGHKQRSNSIVALRAHLAALDTDGRFIPYKQWQLQTKARADRSRSKLLVPTSGSGALYPPNSLHKNVCDAALFMRLCPYADDIWLFWMAKAAGTKHIRLPGSFELVTWRDSQDVGLYHENLCNGRNDSQIRAMEEHFGRLHDSRGTQPSCAGQ